MEETQYVLFLSVILTLYKYLHLGLDGPHPVDDLTPVDPPERLAGVVNAQ